MGPHTAQDGSEDDVRARLRPDALPSQTIGLRASCRPYARIRDSLRESFGLRGGDAVPVLASDAVPVLAGLVA